MKKILITGGGGFVASYLKDIFKSEKVFLTDIAGKGVEKCDITDKKSVFRLVEKISPDEIYHLAAISMPRVEDKKLVERVNVQGTLNLLEAVRKFSPQAKVLLVSTGYVYGNCKRPATEKDRPRPIGIYAQSKLEMEKQALKKFPDLNIYIARPFTHSGKNQGLGFFFPDTAKKIAEGKKQSNPEIEVYNPQTKRDFSHVEDIVSAYKMIMDKGTPKEIYNICSGKSYNILKIFEDMTKRANLKKYTVKRIKHGVVLDLMGNNSKIKNLGWKPEYDIDKIIDDFS